MRLFRRLCLPAAAAVCLPSLLPAQQASQPPAPAGAVCQRAAEPTSDGWAGGTGLAPGDLVRLVVWRATEEYGGELTVAADSTLRHPLYRRVKVAGVPLAEAEQRICEALREYIARPELVIEPLFRVSVGGEVVSPDLLTLPRETTILQAVALAGGPTERGRLNRVRIVRGGRIIETDLTDPAAEWARQPVQSGDQILVTRKRNILTEVIGPLASLTAAAAAIASIVTR